MKPLIRAIEHPEVGSQVRLAGRIGVSPQQLNQWVRGERPLPLEHCPSIETATSGAVRCDDLRPDVQWQRDPSGRVLGYQVRLAPDGGKQVTADKASSHGAAASRKGLPLAKSRTKGRKGETAHG